MSKVHIIRPPNDSKKFAIRNKINRHQFPPLPNSIQTNAVSPPKNQPNSIDKSPRFNHYNKPEYITDPRGADYVLEILNKTSKFKNIVHRRNKDANYIYAISNSSENYYFEVKCKSSKSTEKKYQFSDCSVGIADMLSKTNDHYYVAIVLNIDESPHVLFYKKENDLLAF